MSDILTGPPVDLSYLQEYTDGDPEAMGELIDVFYETFSEGLVDLKKCIENHKDNDEWSSVSHKLKGASGFAGAVYLKDLCAQAQDMKSADPSDRQDLYSKIEENYNTVRLFLENHRK